MKVLANFKDPETIPFLLDVLKSEDPEMRAECASVFGLFHDMSVVSHIQPLLSDSHPKCEDELLLLFGNMLIFDLS